MHDCSRRVEGIVPCSSAPASSAEQWATVRRDPRAGRGTPSARVRPRTDDDLDVSVRVLAAVHRADGYRVNWPADPPSWLSPPGCDAHGWRGRAAPWWSRDQQV